MKHIINLGLIIFGISILSSNSPSDHIYGVLLILLGLYLIYKNNVQILFGNLKKNINHNHNTANCNFDVNYNILNILNHEMLKDYFDSSCFEKNNKILNKVISNGKKLIKEGKINKNIIVNIKDGNIYFDGKLKFEDNFYHEIFIPYELKDFDKNDYYTHAGVTIRIILINGLLKLQLGNFRAGDMNIISTEDIGGEYHTYRNFYDITTIPLMYYLYYLNISKKHLNVVAEGVEGYYTKEGKTFSEEWKKDWRQLHIDLENYNYLNSFGEDDMLDKKANEILDIFSEKSSLILENQNIEIDDHRDESSYVFNLGYLTTFRNDYITLQISDLNEWYEKYQKGTCGYVKEEFIP